MALLHMCLQKGIAVSAAHVNYHHRKEADEEEAYVRSFCIAHHITLHVLNDPFHYTGNFEAAARKWRYDFFEKLVKEHGYRGVLVGHHEDDLLETYFMQENKNLVPSYYGLKEEMLYHGILVKRPLLNYTKEDLVAYCQKNNIRYCIDCSNLSDMYERNRIRHEIVEKMNRFERDMVLKEIRQKNAVMQERSCRIATMKTENAVKLSQYRPLSEEDRFALLRLITDEKKNHSLSFIKECDHILMQKNDFMIPCGKEYLVQDQGKFFLHPGFASYKDIYHSLAELKNVRKSTYHVEAGNPGIYAVSVEEDDFPITIRSFCEGDVIQLRYGKKKVNRFFIDRHIPLYKRKTWPIVENCRKEVILVPGIGCNRWHFSINPDFNVIQYNTIEGDDT